MRRFALVGLLGIAAQLVLNQPAMALQDYFNAFKGRYPGWPTTSTFNCRACHDSFLGGGSRNAYGNAFLSKKGPNIASQATARNIIIDLENEDPDVDAFLSLTEITRNRLPGYAVGSFSQPTNVVTFSSAPRANSNPINSGASTGVSALANDLKINNSIAYSWTASCSGISNGSFSNPNSRTPVYTAANNFTGANRNCTLTVTASPTNDPASASDSFTLVVRNTTPPAPDLVVQSFTSSQASVQTGQSITLSATIKNQGDGSSGAATIKFRRSPDSNINSGFTVVSTKQILGISPDGTRSSSATTTVPNQAGTFFYAACIDPVAGESNTGNNCSNAVPVSVAVPPKPDLIISAISVNKSVVAPGESVRVNATVKNQGSGGAAGTTLRYRQSGDDTISNNDTQRAQDSIGSLGSNQTSGQNATFAAPNQVGTFFYGACVDSVSGESNTGNNCSSAVEVTVAEPQNTVTLTAGPSGSPNPATSGGQVNLTVNASDTLGRTLTFSWTSNCDGLGNGSFNSATSRTPVFTAPSNQTGSAQTCVLSVTASDGQGTNASGDFDLTVNSVVIPDPPSGVVASNNDTAKVVISWNAVANADNYKVFRAASNASGAAAELGPTATTSFEDTTATPGQVFFYFIKTVSGGQESAFSTGAQGQRPAAPGGGVTVSLPASRDAVLCESNDGSEANGRGSFLFAGATADTSQRRRSLIAFDVASVVPAGATITAVTMTLQASKIGDPIARAIALHRSTSEWGEGSSDADGQEGICVAATPGSVTWQHSHFGADLWVASGGDFLAAASAAQTVADLGSYAWGSTAGMVADVQVWLDDASQNFGWILLGDESVSRAAKRFNSAQHPNAALRPSLSVTYLPPGSPANLGSPPAAPAGVSASDGTLSDRVRVTWNAAPGARLYRIERTGAQGNPIEIGTTQQTSFDDLPVRATIDVTGNAIEPRPVASFSYRVRACNAAGCGVGSTADTGSAGSAVAVPAAPLGVSASDGTFSDRVRVTWSAVADAVFYEVHRAESASGPRTNLGDAARALFDDGDAIAGVGFFYFVRACNSAGCGQFSAFDIGAKGTQGAGAAPTILLATLPGSRSVQVGTAASAFATIVNAGDSLATGCRISPATSVPADFSFRLSNPLNNSLGPADTPIDIPAGDLFTFVIVFRPTASFAPTNVVLNADCQNTDPAGSIIGLNTLALAASDTPVPDLVALAATLNGDGIVRVSEATGSGVFAVASVNVGASDTVTVTADTGDPANGGVVALPVSVLICQVDGLGTCLAPPASSVTTTIAAGATPSFTIFVNASGPIDFLPARNRIFVRLTGSDGQVRGATSVAVVTN